jgi:hypothetical protein
MSIGGADWAPRLMTSINELIKRQPTSKFINQDYQWCRGKRRGMRVVYLSRLLQMGFNTRKKRKKPRLAYISESSL